MKRRLCGSRQDRGSDDPSNVGIKLLSAYEGGAGFVTSACSAC